MILEYFVRLKCKRFGQTVDKHVNQIDRSLVIVTIDSEIETVNNSVYLP